MEKREPCFSAEIAFKEKLCFGNCRYASARAVIDKICL